MKKIVSVFVTLFILIESVTLAFSASADDDSLADMDIPPVRAEETFTIVPGITADSGANINEENVCPDGILLASGADMPVNGVPSLGDVDGDGKIRANDASFCLRISAELEEPTPEQFSAADINKDGNVRANDARIILRISAKLESIDAYLGGENETSSAAETTSEESDDGFLVMQITCRYSEMFDISLDQNPNVPPALGDYKTDMYVFENGGEKRLVAEIHEGNGGYSGIKYVVDGGKTTVYNYLDVESDQDPDAVSAEFVQTYFTFSESLFAGLEDSNFSYDTDYRIIGVKGFDEATGFLNAEYMVTYSEVEDSPSFAEMIALIVAGNTAEVPFKIGFIAVGEADSAYDRNFVEGIKTAQRDCGLSDNQVIIRLNVTENEVCYEVASELAEQGCDFIFADSYGHGEYLMQAAEKYPDVQFCGATGDQANSSGIENYHNAYAAVYEGRFLTGIAAGMKLNELIEKGTIKADEAKIGFVSTFPFISEAKSAATAFFLGARYVCPSAEMYIKYTFSWFDPEAENELAKDLIANGCVVLSQYSDSEGVPAACEENSIPDIGYNITRNEIAPNTTLVASRINWAPYFEYVADCLLNGTAIATDWTGTLATGSIQLSELNENCAAPGTYEKIDETAELIKNGSVRVFDTATFTVDGEKVESCMADVVPDEAYTPDVDAIVDGAFAESYFRSAPYFCLDIDGIITE